jgi:DNA ligase D-like protein (predicted polymerase)/DNA ligase D-like protein (predicted 3'-phosphoesterase)
MSLAEYLKKRVFGKTPEPKGGKHAGKQLRFVVQRHHASRLHYDFRLELDGTMKSWAIPKGPSMNPGDKRLAMMVEDHPLDYQYFEGIIPQGNYGAGVVMIWDHGTYTSLAEERSEDAKSLRAGLRSGNLKFRLDGEKLHGEFALVKLHSAEDNSWLLIKHNDEFAVHKAYNSEDEVPKDVKKLLNNKNGEANDLPKWKSNRPKEKETKQEEVVEKPSGSKAYKPMMAKLEPKVFDDPNWIYERKLDGYRAIGYTGKNAKLISRNDIDFSNKYKAIIEELKVIEEEAILDGELVIEDEKGRSNFQDIQNYGNKNSPGLKYYVFDLLKLNGHDLRGMELIKRKGLLKTLIGPLKSKRIIFSDHVEEKGTTLYKKAQKEGWEGIIGKDAHSYYASGTRSDRWLKFKLQNSQEAIICGYSSPTGSRKHFGALVLGINEGDKDKEKVVMETPEKQLADEEIIKLGKAELKLTHLNKVYWKDEGITKGELIHYYRDMADWILPYLVDKAINMRRQPNGISDPGFFQKDTDPAQLPAWIKTAPLHSESNNKDINYIVGKDAATLLYMANLGCIEINPWLSSYKKPDNPDFVVIDIDPHDVPFTEAVAIAQKTKEVFDRMKLEVFIKTSGSKGLHVYCPVGGKYDYDFTKMFAEYVANIIHDELPDITSIERSPAKRPNKTYIDFLQNRRGQTIACAYSVRPKPGATVSAPLHWDEVNDSLKLSDYTIHNMRERVKQVDDPWKDLTKIKNDLKKGLELLKSSVS